LVDLFELRQRTFVIANGLVINEMIKPPARKLYTVPVVTVSSISSRLSGHAVWKSIITHWYLTCYIFTVMHIYKLFSKQQKLFQILVFMFVSTFCKCLSYVGCSESAPVEKSLCYETEAIISIWIIHGTACLTGPSGSRPRKQGLELYHSWIMASLLLHGTVTLTIM